MKVIIFGNGQTAEHTHFYLGHDSPYEVAAFTVDGAYIKEETLFGLPIVPFESVAALLPPTEFKMAVPMSFRKLNALRAEKYCAAKSMGYELISYVSSRASTWPGLVIGDNCFIYENVTIMPFARIGNDVTAAPGSVVGHHSVVKEHCFLAPHAVVAGYVTVEPYCLIGANSTIRDGVIVARECVVSAGVSIHKDTQERGVYVGSRPELLPKPSNELRTWLTWPLR